MITSNAIWETPPSTAQEIWGERLKRQIWPRKTLFWMVMVHLSLYIIRPWELLFPVLGVYHFERIVSLLLVGAIALSVRWEWRGGLQTTSLIVFYLAMWICALMAQNPYLLETEQMMTEYLTIGITYFAILFVVQTRYQLLFTFACYIITMSVYLSKAHWEYFVNGSGHQRQGVRRLIGIELTYGGPNEFAASILFSLPFAYILYRHRDVFCQTWPKAYRAWFAFGLQLYACVAILGVFLTRSRGGAVGVAILVFLVAISAKGNFLDMLRRVVGVVLVLVVGFALLPHDMQSRIATIWDKKQESGKDNKGARASAEGRIYGLLSGLEMFRREPIFGVGVGNFLTYRIEKLDHTPLKAHNLAGEILGETGLVGASAFAFFIATLVGNLRRIRRTLRGLQHPHAPILMSVHWACRTALILMFAYGIVGHNLQIYNWFWVAAYVAVTVNLSRNLRRDQAEQADHGDYDGGDAESHQTPPPPDTLDWEKTTAIEGIAPVTELHATGKML